MNGSLVRSRASTVCGDRRGRRGAVGGISKVKQPREASFAFSVSSVRPSHDRKYSFSQSNPFQAAGELNRRAIPLLIRTDRSDDEPNEPVV